MSYFVLGLGALLSLCGAIALYTGYGIIQVERGWASVIAGSVALSCGIVTIALGLILHRLARLPAVLNAGQRDTPSLREFAWQPDHESSTDVLPESSFASHPAVPPVTAASGIAPAPAPRSWAQRPMRSNFAAARNFLKPRRPVLPPLREAPETDSAPQKASPFRTGSRNQAEPESAFEAGFAVTAGVAMTEAETETWASFASPDEKPDLFDEAKEKIVASAFEEPFSEIQDNLEKPRLQSEQGVSWPAGTAAIETTLEEELFIELHREPESRTGEPASRLATPGQPPLESPKNVADDAQEGLAIVGQYQSAGTSYVMYSDGSIEARTAHAVFHFKSMTELKAFMDSEAQTSKD
jgi:hypothetical protein